jgi:dTMP kinase
LTIVLDVDPAIGLKRSRNRLAASSIDEGLFEELDTAFHERVRAAFLSQAAGSRKHIVVESGFPPLQVIENVTNAVASWLSHR